MTDRRGFLAALIAAPVAAVAAMRSESLPNGPQVVDLGSRFFGMSQAAFSDLGETLDFHRVQYVGWHRDSRSPVTLHNSHTGETRVIQPSLGRRFFAEPGEIVRGYTRRLEAQS